MVGQGVGLVAAAIVLSVAGCAGYTDPGFGGFDDDESGYVALEEMGAGIGNDFGAWDTDANSLLDEDEFSAGIAGFDGIGDESFGVWDSTADGFLDISEFGNGVFGAYDLNDDGIWEDDEFASYDADW